MKARKKVIKNILGLTVIFILVAALNIFNGYYHLSYEFSANSLFLLTTFFLVFMFNLDDSKNLLTPYKIYIYTFFIFYVFQIISTKNSSPYYSDYPYFYKTSYYLLKSSLIFIIASCSFIAGYKIIQKFVKIDCLNSQTLKFLDNRNNFLLYNRILIVSTVSIDIINSYLMTGTFLARYLMRFGVPLGSFALIGFLYPAVLVNNLYIALKFKLNYIQKFKLLIVSAIILVGQFMTGSRSMVFNFMVAALYLGIIYFKNCESTYTKFIVSKYKKHKFISISLVFVLLILIYLVNVVVQYTRQGIGIMEIPIGDLLWRYDTLEVLMVTLRQFPEVEPYMPFYTIKNILMWPIPRRIFPSKSIAFGKYIAYVIWPSYPSTSSAYAGLTFGEFYANFGVVGMAVSLFILGIFLGITYKTLFEKKNLNIRSLLYGYLLLGLYGFLRGDFTTKLIHLIIPFIAMFAIVLSLKLIKRNFNKKKET